MSEPEIVVKAITEAPSAIEQLVNYGALGIIVIILVTFIWWYIKRVDKVDLEVRKHHHETLEKQVELLNEMMDRFDNERNSWRNTIDGMYTKTVQSSEKVSTALTELSELIRHRVPRE